MADRLGPISASQFVANNAPVVEPRAVQALTEAFRSGQIRADEIADRAMVRPAQEAAAQQAADPLVVEARKQEILAKSKMAQAEAEQMRIQSQIPKVIQSLNQELASKGLQVFPDTGGEWTPAKSAEVTQMWKDLKTWEAEFASAVAQDKSLKEVDITQPSGQVEKISYEEGSQRRADPVRAASVKDWIRANASPRQWIQSGKPPSPSLFGPDPGQVAAAPVAPEIVAGQRAPGFDAQPAPLPGAVPAPSSVSGGLVIKPAGAVTKAPTEMQAKAGTAVARMMSADEVLQNLQKQGFNPSATQNWLQDYLIGPFEALKTADKKTYDTAASNWIQGLLRLESGAAIAAKEQKWYENTFFARPGDPPSVQQIKAEMRSDVEKIVNELAAGGGLDVAALTNIRRQGEILNASPMSKGAVEQTTIGGKVYNVDRSSGQVRLIPVSGSGVQVQPYNQPDRLGKSGKVVVEKKKDSSAKALRGF